ncbi:MAG: sugar phosphate nucleotidyltransferase [Akkermansiaceae bacterium]|jgi:NDP-sugar pyrophosphorylase family protein|nr:sugar phosphate nucleotidyltransferase [Akkermansiaceae bacterium]
MIRKAFLLGAGLGTRLRPLTDRLPKPLVPLFHRPMVEWAAQACALAGIEEFAVNTHHLPAAWTDPLRGLGEGPWTESDLRGGNGLPAQSGLWQDRPIHLFHEPELLETGGGIRNIAEWIAGDPVLVHNGDIFSTLPLAPLIAAHETSGNLATLALRSSGTAKHIAHHDGKVIDIREMLGRAPGTHVFSGIYVFSPGLLDFIGEGKVSVIPAFLELTRIGALGAVVLDDGEWFDLGDPESYLAAHRDLDLAEKVHRDALIAPDASILRSTIGPRAEIGAGAVVTDSVVWPGAVVAPGERIDGAIRM